MAPIEFPFFLALIGALSGGVANQVLPMVKAHRAQSVCANARPAEAPPQPTQLRHGYGWGREERSVVVCLPPSTATMEDEQRPWKRVTWENAHDDRRSLAASAGLHALLVAWLARALVRRHRELVTTHGHDVPLEPRDGYREPVKVRRELPADERALWKDNTRRAAVAWGLSTAVVAWAGSGQAMVPMPWALALWSALTLPGAVAHVRWRGKALWGVWLPVIGAVAMVLGGPWACAWVAVVSGVCSLCARSEERAKRSGRGW